MENLKKELLMTKLTRFSNEFLKMEVLDPFTAKTTNTFLVRYIKIRLAFEYFICSICILP